MMNCKPVNREDGMLMAMLAQPALTVVRAREGRMSLRLAMIEDVLEMGKPIEELSFRDCNLIMILLLFLSGI